MDGVAFRAKRDPHFEADLDHRDCSQRSGGKPLQIGGIAGLIALIVDIGPSKSRERTATDGRILAIGRILTNSRRIIISRAWG